MTEQSGCRNKHLYACFDTASTITLGAGAWNWITELDNVLVGVGCRVSPEPMWAAISYHLALDRQGSILWLLRYT